MNSKRIKAISQATGIVLIAAVLGLAANSFHPRSVKITSKRPALKFAADTVLTLDLPGVSVMADGVKNEKESSDPLLITTAQVLLLKQNDQLLFLDARTEAEFSSGYIPGALNLPLKNLAEYQSSLDSLPQDKWLVCYCDGPPCDQAELLAHELIIAGYQLVAVYFDGLNGWKKSGNEIEGKGGKDQ